MLTVAATLPAAGLSALTAQAANAATPEKIGTAPMLPHGAVRAGVTADTTTLKLDVELRPRDPAALAQFVQGVSDPHSAMYKHYLARGEFASVFGPTPATIQAVSGELRAEGLTPGTVSEDGLTIPVTTTVAKAATAFHTGFANYRLAGHTVYANTAAPEMSSAVAGDITGIVGLTNVQLVHRIGQTARKVGQASAVGSAAVTPKAKGAQFCSSIRDNLATNQFIDGQNYWEPQALSGSTVYNTQAMYGNYGDTGQGVTVGLFELEPFDVTDVNNYKSCFGVNPSVSAVNVDGGPAGVASPDTGLGFESTLDIEMVAGMAPGASILVYQGPDATPPAGAPGATDQDVINTYSAMINQDRAQVISTSWGGCDTDILAGDPGFLTSESNLFSVAAAQGQSIVAAAGDSGSTDCFPDGDPANDTVLNTDDPASQALVTAVGGTSLVGTTNPVMSTWNNPDLPDGTTAGATGGGVAIATQLTGAANYQAGIQAPGYTNACNAPDGSFCRQVPDVAAMADPEQGYLMVFGHPSATIIDLWVIGGTSAAAPLWGAIAALADAGNACAANGPAGFLNPALYQHQNAMTDVTTGNNDLPDSGYTGGLYVAGAGYDMTTGLGAPKTPSVVEAVCDTPTTAAGSSYHPVAPTRVLDTRSRIGVTTTTPIGAGKSIKLQLTGTHGIPTTGVTAVVLNVTATQPTAGGFFTVFPDGTPRPTSTNLNFSKGQTIANLVTVPVGKDGAIDIFNLAGTTHAVADLEGFYTTDTGSLYNAVAPVRVLDTRSANGVTTKTPIPANSAIKLQIAGTHGVPATGVTAVVLNVTAVTPSVGGFFTVYPDGTARPSASSVNFSKAQTIPNLVTVSLGSDGAVDIYNLAGTTHAVADLAGYYTTDGTGLKFHPSAPHRMVDTRNGTGVAVGQHTPIGANGTFGLPLQDTNGLGNLGPLGSAGAVVMNVTVTSPTVGGVLTVFPSNVAKPTVSNLNFSKGETIPNAVIVKAGSPFIDFNNLAGTTHVVVDLFGYFSAG
jgi:subtilase family serine protease